MTPSLETTCPWSRSAVSTSTLYTSLPFLLSACPCWVDLYKFKVDTFKSNTISTSLNISCSFLPGWPPQSASALKFENTLECSTGHARDRKNNSVITPKLNPFALFFLSLGHLTSFSHDQLQGCIGYFSCCCELTRWGEFIWAYSFRALVHCCKEGLVGLGACASRQGAERDEF